MGHAQYQPGLSGLLVRGAGFVRGQDITWLREPLSDAMLDSKHGRCLARLCPARLDPVLS